MVAVGLVLVLLSKGCDSISRRSVDRAEAMAQKAVEQFNDDVKTKELAIQREIDEITARGEVKPRRPEEDRRSEQTPNRSCRFLRQRSQGQRGRASGGSWKSPPARPTANHKINGYWRELFFVFAAIVLSLGLLVVSWGAEGAERWITLMMLAIITFSLFVGGLAWVAIPR